MIITEEYTKIVEEFNNLNNKKLITDKWLCHSFPNTINMDNIL